MKRCPLCDFIYEDDQGVCEMDGIELVHDGGALIPVGKEMLAGRPASGGSPRRRRTLHLLLGFGLGAAVFSAYFTSANQAEPANREQTPASYAARPAPPAVETTPTAASPAAEAAASPTEEPTPAPTPATPATEPRASSASGKKPRAGGGGKKKESKLSSILNKTGRMLKKPFSF